MSESLIQQRLFNLHSVTIRSTVNDARRAVLPTATLHLQTTYVLDDDGSRSLKGAGGTLCSTMPCDLFLLGEKVSMTSAKYTDSGTVIAAETDQPLQIRCEGAAVFPHGLAPDVTTEDHATLTLR